MVAHTKMKTQHGSIRPRSAAAPMASAGVIAANIHWKMAKVRSGMSPVFCAKTPMKPKLSRLPMKGLAVLEKASE